MRGIVYLKIKCTKLNQQIHWKTKILETIQLHRIVNYESELCSEKRIISKKGKWVLSRKRDNDSNSGYVRKWKT